MADGTVGHRSSVHLRLSGSSLVGGIHGVQVAWRSIYWISRILESRIRVRLWPVIRRAFRRF